MALRAVGWLALASLVCGIVVLLAAGPRHLTAVLLGAAGPLAAAIGTWLLVARRHATAPERLTSTMIALFAAKLVLFAAYVGAVVLFVPMDAVVFVAGFTAQYIVLHLLEAVFLRRLFAAAPHSR